MKETRRYNLRIQGGHVEMDQDNLMTPNRFTKFKRDIENRQDEFRVGGDPVRVSYVPGDQYVEITVDRAKKITREDRLDTIREIVESILPVELVEAQVL
ncbi:MAG: hypothetical protein ABIG28_03435 [archaeon]